jgi:hypothetical protein
LGGGEPLTGTLKLATRTGSPGAIVAAVWL